MTKNTGLKTFVAGRFSKKCWTNSFLDQALKTGMLTR